MWGILLSVLCVAVQAQADEPKEARVSEGVESRLRALHPDVHTVDRAPHQDIGAYAAYELRRASAGPGDPGHVTAYLQGAEIMSPEQSDWRGFLVAAPPERVAAALALPLDTVFVPSGPQGANEFHPLHRLPEDVRAQVKDPSLNAQGALEFFVMDGRGDPPSNEVFKVTISAKSDRGLSMERRSLAP